MARSRLAKLSPPRSSQALVRERLHARLDALAREAAVWIAAGPGSGKTTLASSWALSRGERVLWYRIDEGDADAASAFGYFAQLAGTVSRRVRLPVFRSRPDGRLAPFARSFFRAFYAAIPAASTLVLDDAHLAAGDAVTLLEAAVAEAPHDVRLLVLSRTTPPAAMVDEVARGTLRVLEPGDLAFTADEAAALLADRMPADQARALCRRVEGWAAGLLLVAEGKGRAYAHSPSAVGALLAERLLAPLTADAVRLLCAVSLLPDVDRAALDEIEARDAEAVLDRLREQHAFVSRLERQPPSWRLHDLLRDALRARFETTGDEAWRARMRTTAARLAEARGSIREAVRLHAEAGDSDAAFRLAAAQARPLVAAHRLDELEAVLAALDPGRVAGSAMLQLAIGEAAWARNDARSAVGALERAYVGLSARAPSPEALLVAAIALGAILEGWQDYEGVEAWAGRVREHIAARDRVASAGDGLRIDTSCLHALDMLLDRAAFADRQSLIGRMLATLRSSDPEVDADGALGASSALIECATYEVNDEHLFADVVAATLPWLRSGRASPIGEAGWLVTYGSPARRWPVPATGLPASTPIGCIEHALDLARRYGARSTQFSAALFLLNIAVSENDLATVQQRLQALRDATDPAQPSQAINLLLAEVGAMALQQDWRRAASMLDRAEAIARRSDLPASEFWTIELVRQRIAIATGHGDAAREALARLAAGNPEGMRRTLTTILADVADAAASIQARGEVPLARLRSIMEAASAQSWPGFATLLAPLAARLCAEALRHGIETAFVRRVVYERRLTAPSPYEPYWPWPVRIHALGTLRVEVDGAPLAFGARAQRKPLDLLKLLVAHGPGPVDAALVLDALWPDAEGGAARAAYDMTTMRLRKLLVHDDAVRLDAGRIRLDHGIAWVDAWAYAAGALDDYAGPLFGADAVEAWWVVARERLHQAFLRRVRDRGRSLEREADLEGAIAAYESGLAQDPLAEEFYQGLIRCHRASGREADALRAFRRCREQLSIVLGVSPSPATLALVGASAR